MRKFFGTLFAILLGLIFVIFAVANHHLVRVSFNPFNSGDSALSIALPEFELIIAVAILGVVAGGCATWFGQRRWRRAARQHEADARAAKAELAQLRADALAARGDAQRLALTSRAGFYGAVGRDKQDATL